MTEAQHRYPTPNALSKRSKLLSQQVQGEGWQGGESHVTMRPDMTNKKQHPITKGPAVDRKQHRYSTKIPQVMKVQATSSRLQNEIRNYLRGVYITTQRLGFRQAQGTFLDLHKFLLLQSSQQAIFPLEGRVSPSPDSNSIRTNWLKESVDLRWTPHPVTVTIGDYRDYIRVLLYSYYTTITGWGVLLP